MRTWFSSGKETRAAEPVATKALKSRCTRALSAPLGPGGGRLAPATGAREDRREDRVEELRVGLQVRRAGRLESGLPLLWRRLAAPRKALPERSSSIAAQASMRGWFNTEGACSSAAKISIVTCTTASDWWPKCLNRGSA